MIKDPATSRYDAGGNKIKYGFPLDYFVKSKVNHNMHCTSSRKGRACSLSQIYLITEPLPWGALPGTDFLSLLSGQPWLSACTGRSQGTPTKQWVFRGCNLQGKPQCGCSEGSRPRPNVVGVFTRSVTEQYTYSSCWRQVCLKSWQGGDENFKGLCRCRWARSNKLN